MLIITKTVEFCKDNSDNWECHYDYDEKGKQYISISSRDLRKSITLNTDLIKKIIIESNQLCIALKCGLMVWLGGDTRLLEINSTDYNNPLFKD